MLMLQTHSAEPLKKKKNLQTGNYQDLIADETQIQWHKWR